MADLKRMTLLDQNNPMITPSNLQTSFQLDGTMFISPIGGDPLGWQPFMQEFFCNPKITSGRILAALFTPFD
jgi:hypothetical protein